MDFAIGTQQDPHQAHGGFLGRCETAFLNDGSWLADRLAAEAGLAIESDGFAHVLWEATTSAFSRERWVAERKFGPHFVVAKTPISNIRLTTFFAGEAEVRLVDHIPPISSAEKGLAWRAVRETWRPRRLWVGRRAHGNP